MADTPAECPFLQERRPLGKTGLQISPLGFGASPLGNVFGDIDEKSGIRAVHEAVRLGINLFDVSPYYGNTLAETVLGKALRELPRESFVLSTKVGRYGPSTFDFSAERVTASVTESMARLHVDRIDVIQCHDIEFGDLDLVARETLPALAKLKADGKVGAIGITGYPLEIFPYVAAVADPGGVDVMLSYCHYNLQNDRLAHLLPWARREGLGVLSASPLCMGLLTPSGGPAWHPADADTKAAARFANKICEDAGATLPDVALQFAVDADPGAVASTLVGIDSVDTLYKNVRALNAARDDALHARVREVFAPVKNRRWPSGNL